MSARVDELIAEIIRREGGYNDLKADKGGATKFGVSLRYARGVGLDNDHDGDVDKDDIQLVTVDQASALYREDFFERPRLATLPEPVQAVLFDWAVNSGAPRAIMGLQAVLNLAGFAVGEPDGVIGKKTRQACEQAAAAMGPYLVNAVCEVRERFYRDLVARDPSQSVFLKGWVARARAFRVEVPA